MQECLLHMHLALPSYADMAFLVIRYARPRSVIISIPSAFCLSTCCQKTFAIAYAGWRGTHSNKKITCRFVDRSPLFSHPATFLHLHGKYFLDFNFFLIFTDLISLSSFTFFFLRRCYNWGTGQIQCLICKYLPLFPYMWIHNAVSNRY